MHNSPTSAHARAHGAQREVAGAAFYTHVTTLARQPDDRVVVVRPRCIVDYEKSLFPITLPPIEHRRSTEYYHPQDPRRERQVARERKEFAIKWRRKNQDGVDAPSDEFKGDVCEIGDEKRRGLCESGTSEAEIIGGTAGVITIGENEDGSEVMSRTEPAARKRSHEEADNGRRNDTEDHTRSYSVSKIEERSSKTMKKEKIVRRDNGSPEVASTLSTVVEDGEPIDAKRSKVTKDDSWNCEPPELLDERVGYANPFIVRIPRTAITLNLNSNNSHNGGSAKKNTAHARPSTEIRLADSSVPDFAPIGNEEIIVPVKESIVTNKPKIVEDVTCLEGTMFSSTSLKNATRKKRPPETDEKSARTSADDSAPKKSRINEKFRSLFGSDVTLSESDEESRITEKLASRKRRNESRMSSDSGVCLNDQISDIVSMESLEKPRENESPGECPRDNFRENHKEYIRENSREYSAKNIGVCPSKNLTEKHKLYAEGNPEECTGDNPRGYTEDDPGEYPRERLKECPGEQPKKYRRERPKECHRENPSGDPREISSMKKDDAEFANAPVRSMPLLDAVCDQRAEEARGEALPDSSTSLFEKISAPPDSSSGGKLTILVTPLNVQDSDAFDPLRLELDLEPEDAQISTPTSTTSGPPIVEPIKLERSFEETENFVTTDVEESCPIGLQDDRISIKEDFSPEADTESCDGDRLVIAEDLDFGPDQTQTEPDVTEESSQLIPGTTASVEEIPIETQWRPDSMIESDKNLTNGTDVDSSSNSNATAVKNFDETKNLAGSSLPIKEIPRPETGVVDRENVPKDPTFVTGATGETHNKLLIISATIVDIDPESGLLIGPAKPVNVLDEVSTGMTDDRPESGPAQRNIENYVSERRSKNVDETIASNNIAALSEVTRDNRSLIGPSSRKSENLGFGYAPNALPPQGLEDRTKVSQSLSHEVPDLELPKCVLDVEKPKDIPKAPSFRVLHPSELGSRWCPTPLATDTPQNQQRFPTNPTIAQPPLYPPIRQFSPYTVSVPQIQVQIPSSSQILRHPFYPTVRQASPEVLIQTPPPSPLEQMQFLVSQTSTSAPGVEDLSAKKSSGYVNASLGPRPAHTGSGYTPSSIADKIASSMSPMEKHSLMGRIFDALLSMNESIERIKRGCNISTIKQLDRDFNAKRACLFVELGRYASIQGTSDLRTTVTKIINYYDYHVPPERRVINVERTMYMLQLDHTTTTSTRTSYPAKPPPPYRPSRPSVTQSSPFTEQQRQILHSQMAIYKHLSHVLYYQLLAQRCAEQEAEKLRIAETAKPKRTRRRKPKAPAGQKQTAQTPIVGLPEQSNLATVPHVRGLAPAPVDNRSNLLQTVGSTIESTIEQIMQSKCMGNNTVPEKRTEQIIELAVHDPSIDDKIANIVNDLYRQYPAERMAEGRTVERNFQGQLTRRKSQGQNLEGDIQGQAICANQQGQSLAKTVRFQAVERNSRDKSIESSAQYQTVGRNFQGRIVERSVHGQAIYTNVQGQTVEEHVQAQTVEINVQGRGIENSRQRQIVEGSVQAQAIDVSLRGQIVERNVQGQIFERNIQGQTVERNVHGHTIEINVQDQNIEKRGQGQIIEGNVQGQAIDINVRGQTVESNVQCQTIEINVRAEDTEKEVESQSSEANVQGQLSKEKSVQLYRMELNARDEAIEDSLQGQTIVEEGSAIESALNRSSSSVEDGNTSVLDVLKEFEILDSITKGPVSRVSKALETAKSRDDDKLPDSITKERGSKAANPECPEDSPSSSTISREVAAGFDGKETVIDEESVPATAVDVPEGSSRTIPVITIDDDEYWDLASTNSVETVRDAEHATVVDEFSILDVKSISKDVFNNMGERVVDVMNTPTAKDEDETDDECVVIKTELSDCFRCGKSSQVVCEQCRLASYCSPECHQEHWSATHHLTCKPAPKEMIESNA